MSGISYLNMVLITNRNFFGHFIFKSKQQNQLNKFFSYLAPTKKLTLITSKYQLWREFQTE
jgi:hypothetical protein